jgi:hypothetical protein
VKFVMSVEVPQCSRARQIASAALRPRNDCSFSYALPSTRRKCRGRSAERSSSIAAAGSAGQK